jgi:hypothetical protein
VLRKQCALCVEKEGRKEAPDHLPCCKVDRAIREDPKSYVVRVEVGSKVPMFDEVDIRNPDTIEVMKSIQILSSLWICSNGYCIMDSR